ncbi:MAG TPA: ATP-binding cassette domain-containing protein [Anaerolineales bacterium]|nr:ATP-binding cassette domain-containing protein [Anaerolineales bacterium]HMV95440.1 ATP-binding cassette domain-containing protein [Anaerolineales bacterium]HMX18427.1 ATP-binding cassette domain-containing protein [Anaerolineales bacterium]HMX73661.1 ATP-binding cassette domain-containing protein [Anaerolineales bacterium]HMZ41469.1 ATP-binding cassette domain-containing protein [Anaerolineales bacterium]
MNKTPLRTQPKSGPAQVADFAPESMIELRSVVKKFSNAAGEFTVLKGVDLTINRGEFVSIVGKSGSGKSTLLNMITGIDHPTDGLVVVNGTDIYTGVSESQRSKWRGKNLGIVFQFFQLLPMLTLLENVMLPMDYVDMYDFDERPTRAMELLKLVGLEKFANKLPVLVSTGQQQLAAIARAMACDPPLLVADEPTGNLDSRSADTIIRLFELFVSQGKTIVMVTHDPSLTSRTNRNIIISDGELINETISRALPQLRHRHMLEFTRLAEERMVSPNETILQRGQAVEHFFMIRKGEVDLHGQTALRLRPRQFFGEIELLQGGGALTEVRAGNEPVELLTIPRADFTRVIQESPITAEVLLKVAQEKMEALKEDKLAAKP